MDIYRFTKLIDEYNSSFKEEAEYKKEITDFLKENEVMIGRQNQRGHITGSAWIVNHDRKKVLLVYHKRLDRWLQPGGHMEGEEDILDTAMREAAEETGLTSLRCVDPNIFDIDIHTIPRFKDEKQHIHYDIRFLLEADDEEKVKVSSESKDVRWVELKYIKRYSDSPSITRMAEKIEKRA